MAPLNIDALVAATPPSDASLTPSNPANADSSAGSGGAPSFSSQLQQAVQQQPVNNPSDPPASPASQIAGRPGREGNRNPRNFSNDRTLGSQAAASTAAVAPVPGNTSASEAAVELAALESLIDHPSKGSGAGEKMPTDPQATASAVQQVAMLTTLPVAVPPPVVLAATQVLPLASDAKSQATSEPKADASPAVVDLPVAASSPKSATAPMSLPQAPSQFKPNPKSATRLAANVQGVSKHAPINLATGVAANRASQPATSTLTKPAPPAEQSQLPVAEAPTSATQGAQPHATNIGNTAATTISTVATAAVAQVVTPNGASTTSPSNGSSIAAPTNSTTIPDVSTASNSPNTAAVVVPNVATYTTGSSSGHATTIRWNDGSTTLFSHGDQSRFVQRVAGAFRAADDNGSPVRLRLSPPELGSLHVEIRFDQGQMHARIEAETPQAQSLLLDNLSSLRDRLEQQDIKVMQFDIGLMNSGGGNTPQNPSAWQQPQGDAVRSNLAAAQPATNADPAAAVATSPTTNEYSQGVNVLI